MNVRLTIVKCMVTKPIVGLYFKLDWLIKVNEVEIQSRKSARIAGEEPMASITLECEEEMILIKAKEHIDRSLAVLTTTIGNSLYTDEDTYFTFLSPAVDTPLKSWGYHRYSTTRTAFGVVNPRQMIIPRLDKIQNMKAEKRKVFEKAALLYREAVRLEKQQPLLALVAYFSTITTIVRDTDSKRIDAETLEETLRPIAAQTGLTGEEYSEMFEHMYGNRQGRSGVDHGWIDIADPLLIGNARLRCQILRYWTKEIIERYVNESQMRANLN